jgi:transposase-like protein
MAKGQRNPVLERQWRERVAAWTKSGLTVREFCLRHGLRETAFHFWKRELQARDEQSAVSRSPKPTFVPVTILPNAEPQTQCVGTVEVRCPSGHVVTLPAWDASVLSNLFAALTSLAPEGRPC